MADDACPLPWTPQQWAALRAVVRDAARKSRVASTFLPLAGREGDGGSTVPSNWVDRVRTNNREPGVARERLEIRAGKTLHLVTVSCNLYLRGSEVADPNLDAVKTLLRRAGEVIGRVEDAIVFRGLRKEEDVPRRGDDGTGEVIVKPEIYTVSGGRDFIGLVQSPYMHQENVHKELDEEAKTSGRRAKGKVTVPDNERMCVSVGTVDPAALRQNPVVQGTTPSPIVDAIIESVQKLERHGHFGPFAVVLGQRLFRLATTPTNPSLVLPTDRIVPFLDGGQLLRSGTLEDSDGVVVALGGSPVELVLDNDIDIDYLQRTLEPRYVVRVYERFVLRIKELDAVCKITDGGKCP